MLPTRSIGLIAVCLFTAVVGAQTVVGSAPALIGFIDISTTGGTQVTSPAVADDSEHNIVTTIGNALFPAGNVRIGNNGVAVSGITTGEIGFTNVALGATANPTGIPSGTGAILPFWDDMYTTATIVPPAEIWWQENSGVLFIMWKNEHHFLDTTANAVVTFQLQVFSNPGPCDPWIQMVYSDTVFGGVMAVNDNGASATIGYVKGTNSFAVRNAQYSFDTPNAVTPSSVVSVFPPMTLAIHSPAGPG